MTQEYEECDETFCSEGFGAGECCSCYLRLGIEHCEFMCPFQKNQEGYRACWTKECIKSVNDELAEWER